MPYTPIKTVASPPTWRPWYIRARFLLSFAILCLLLCIAIELVIRSCSATGCHVYGSYSPKELSGISNFIYNQLPTVVSLGLSLLWALPHHDIVRLEPFFQMSVPGGAKAADSLFLTYPYIFSLFTPFVAGKHRHYVVFLSACVLLVMTILITPLISGIFDDKILEKSMGGTAMRGELRSGVGDIYNLSASFTYEAYDYSWLGGTLPAFTTPEFALLPVKNQTLVGNETWIADTTLFEAELKCESARTIDFSNSNGKGIISSKGRAYEVIVCDRSLWEEVSLQDSSPKTASDCGVYTTFRTPWTSILKMLPQNVPSGSWRNGSEVYLLAWATGADQGSSNSTSAIPRPTNITALFCMTSYYSQPVTANFTMPDGNVGHVNRTGTRSPFTSVFNFERVIYGEIDAVLQPEGVLNSVGDLVGLGYAPRQLPNVDSQLRRRLGPRPPSNEENIPTGLEVVASHSVVYMEDVLGIRGFALSNRTADSLDDLLDPKILSRTYEKTLKMLFALAVTMEMVDKDISEVIPVMRHIVVRGFIVDMLWARVVQGGLAAVVAMVLVLMVLIRRRPCKLDGEPNSLAATLRLLSASPELSALMENSEFSTPETLHKMFEQGNGRFSLDLVEGQGPRVLVTNMHGHKPLPAPNEAHTIPWVHRLWALRNSTGVTFLICFAVLIMLLVASFVCSRVYNGLPLIAPTNSFGYKFLFSYVPIAIGTAMEPVLVSLGECMCMLGPYTALNNADSIRSLIVDYDRSPPHFQLISSLRSGHFALAALTVAILLSNVLAVTFSGLFSPTIVDFQVERDIQTYPTPSIRDQFTEPAQEMYFILAGQLSGQVATPKWTTEEYYVLPFYPADNDAIQQYTGPTLGIGVDIECSLAHSNVTCKGSATDVTACPTVLDPYYFAVDDPCWGFKRIGYVMSTEEFLTVFPFDSFNFDSTFRSANCSDTLFTTWVERPASPYHRNQSSPYRSHFDEVTLMCKTVEKVVKLMATVDNNGRVLSASRIYPSDEDLTAFYPPGTNPAARLAPTFIDVIRTGLNAENSIDSHRIRWFNHLIATIQPSIVRNLTNITHLPDTKYVVEAYKDVYRRVFAINLQLYAKDIISMGKPSQVQGTAIVHMKRVEVNSLMFYIGLFILLFIVSVIVEIYWGAGWRQRPDGHLPKDLAGTYTLLYASNAKEECGRAIGKDPQERAKKLATLQGRYKYGSFDNGEHYGVYREGELESLDSEMCWLVVKEQQRSRD